MGRADALRLFVRALGLIVRLEYDYRFDSAARELRVRFGVPQASSMPASRFDVLEGAWVSIDNDERARYATEYANRMVLVLAAAAFSSSLSMRRCVVEKWDALRDASLSVAFDRTEFTTHLMPLASELDGAPLSCEAATERLSRSVTPERMQRDIPASLQAAPREDTRPLPRALQDLLLADSIDELEVMEHRMIHIWLDLTSCEHLHRLTLLARSGVIRSSSKSSRRGVPLWSS